MKSNWVDYDEIIKKCNSLIACKRQESDNKLMDVLAMVKQDIDENKPSHKDLIDMKLREICEEQEKLLKIILQVYKSFINYFDEQIKFYEPKCDKKLTENQKDKWENIKKRISNIERIEEHPLVKKVFDTVDKFYKNLLIKGVQKRERAMKTVVPNMIKMIYSILYIGKFNASEKSKSITNGINNIATVVYIYKVMTEQRFLKFETSDINLSVFIDNFIKLYKEHNTEISRNIKQQEFKILSDTDIQSFIAQIYVLYEKCVDSIDNEEEMNKISVFDMTNKKYIIECCLEEDICVVVENERKIEEIEIKTVNITSDNVKNEYCYTFILKNVILNIIAMIFRNMSIDNGNYLLNNSRHMKYKYFLKSDFIDLTYRVILLNENIPEDIITNINKIFEKINKIYENNKIKYIKVKHEITDAANMPIDIRKFDKVMYKLNEIFKAEYK